MSLFASLLIISLVLGQEKLPHVVDSVNKVIPSNKNTVDSILNTHEEIQRLLTELLKEQDGAE